jgi:hypothetical protein
MRVLLYRYMFRPFLLGHRQACSILALLTVLMSELGYTLRKELVLMLHLIYRINNRY